MMFDIFLSICQTDVDGHKPNEKQMFASFFDQVRLADALGFGTAWVAETHLSCQVQKETPYPVIPHFKGEIGLNTDILQLAHKVFAMTQNINVGSAIRNILCNGGPIAHAEAVRTFLTLHQFNGEARREERLLNIGFASGRFEFSNYPYGIFPRNALEKAAWPVMKSKILLEAIEIFLRCLRGDLLSSKDVRRHALRPADFRKPEDWEKVVAAFKSTNATQFGGVSASDIREVPIEPRWKFDKVGVIPFEAPLQNLRLTLGSHDPEAQALANQYFPVDVFNLSITPPEQIEETHRRMREVYHPQGGEWNRSHMPRTVMVFLEDTSSKAKKQAERAWVNYWDAMEGTIDNKKVESAVSNSIAGDASEVVDKIREKYHPGDRLMLWFDFNNHDNESVKRSMRTFIEKVAPKLSEARA